MRVIIMHVFVTSCVNCPSGEDINEMVSHPLAKEISNGHFIKNIAPKLGIKEDVMNKLGYDSVKFFSEDWGMNCNYSYYQGVPCVYVQHSRIEYIYVDEDDFNLINHTSEESDLRQEIMYNLEEKLDEHIEKRIVESALGKGKVSLSRILKEFYLENKDDFIKNRIHLSCLIDFRSPLQKAAMAIDKKYIIPDIKGKPEEEKSPSI